MARAQGEIRIGASQLAKAVELSTRRIRQLVDEGWLPKSVGGKYPLLPSVTGLVRFYRHLAENDEKKRGERLRNELTQTKLEILRRDYVRVDEASRMLTRIITAAKQRLLSIPPAMSQKLALLREPEAIGEELRREIISALEELSKASYK